METRPTMRNDVGRVSIPAVLRPIEIMTESQLGLKAVFRRLTTRPNGYRSTDFPADERINSSHGPPNLKPLTLNLLDLCPQLAHKRPHKRYPGLGKLAALSVFKKSIHSI